MDGLTPIGSIEGRGEHDCRDEKYREEDLEYLRRNMEASSMSTGVILNQFQQYISAMVEDMQNVAVNLEGGTENDPLVRFRLAGMQCRSEQMREEIQIFRFSVSQFAGAEKEVKKTLARRGRYCSDIPGRLTSDEATGPDTDRRMENGFRARG